MNNANNINPLGSSFVSGAIGVPVTVLPGARKVYFPDNSLLRNKVIKHIDLCDNLLSSSLSGEKVFPNDVRITFFGKNTQTRVFDNVDSILFKTSRRGGNRICLNHVFDFPSSYISIDKNTIDAPHVLFFVFWYNEAFASTPINASAGKKIESLEIKLTRARTYFSENNTLRDVKMRNILLSLQPLTGSGAESISNQTAKRAFLTLRKGNTQFIKDVPLLCFLQSNDAYLLNLQNIRFDFTNSYIELVDAQQTDYKSVFFNVIVEE